MTWLTRGLPPMKSVPAATYDADFFDKRAAACLASAKVLVPLAIDLVRPQSVVDVGCGDGAWLSVFRAHGVARICGLDNFVQEASLLIPTDCFTRTDLARPFSVTDTFDLCVCLEVAEHIPGRAASGFIASLVKLAPAVLFSAAVPGQGGRGHVNEQWPSYWTNLFADHDFVRLDPFRRHLWQRPDVSWWYQQNVLLYVARDHIARNEHYAHELKRARHNHLTLVDQTILDNHASLANHLRVVLARLWKSCST